MPLHAVPDSPQLPEGSTPELLLRGEFDPDLLAKLCKGFLLAAREATLQDTKPQYKEIDAIHLVGDLSFVGELPASVREGAEVEFEATRLAGVTESTVRTIDHEGIFTESLTYPSLVLRGTGRLLLGEQLLEGLRSRLTIVQNDIEVPPTFSWRNNNRPKLEPTEA